MKSLSGTCSIMLVILIATVQPLRAQITLIAAGKSDYVIVLPADPAPAEQRGAREVQSHLKQMTGVELPIEIEPKKRLGRAVADQRASPAARRITDALVSEWMNGVYGRAAPPTRKWFDLLHDRSRSGRNRMSRRRIVGIRRDQARRREADRRQPTGRKKRK